jgi:hypothetical protein
MNLSPDILGWLAAGLTLACFASGDMLRLRLLALAANAAFAAYGWHADLLPVLALHLVLAPVNAWRLAQLLRARRSERLSPASSSPRLSGLARPAAAHRGSS